MINFLKKYWIIILLIVCIIISLLFVGNKIVSMISILFGVFAGSKIMNEAKQKEIEKKTEMESKIEKIDKTTYNNVDLNNDETVKYIGSRIRKRNKKNNG